MKIDEGLKARGSPLARLDEGIVGCACAGCAPETLNAVRLTLVVSVNTLAREAFLRQYIANQML